ncbi:DUF1684 domain-containing protein [Patiriisocius marinus]|uniref:DUF1684 domain-containing protein n=1 Tax=Patiriisocius marinus TaxID=1397112 RepID=A0A5J4IXU6_9FLAO|nr:DUF1684 domain-containing protein [Patiriisocius marinus]GER59766.1 hypothetical protein ULMA_18740 [Patiriisocius marinus]
MKNVITLIILCFAAVAFSQHDTDENDALAYQFSENEKFASPETTILTPEDFKDFKELDFFPINLTYRVTANFKRTASEIPFLMPTTTTRLPEYVKYGEAHFEIEGVAYKLNLYQNTALVKDPKYVDYLFLPFTDLTSGEESYGGGRFLDTKIPKGNTLVLDFNKAYNPYCAYNSNYSCPIPPKENHLELAVRAGVMAYEKH